LGFVFLVNLLGIMPLNSKSVGLALCVSAIASAGAQVIPAPFGLKWGDPLAPILSFAEHTGSKINTQPGSSGRETIDVQGPFSNQRYQRLGFTFQADRLVQVAVYYRAPDESNEARELLAALRGEIEQSFGALLKQLPNKSEMDALLTDINQAGLGRGLQFELFRPASQERVADFYAELPISVRVTGTYHDMGAFASDVAQLPRIVTLNDIGIVNDKGTLTMEATAKTFRYLDEDEVANQRKARQAAAKK